MSKDIITLATVDYNGEPVCLFIDKQEGFHADPNPPTTLPTSMKIKVGDQVKEYPCAYAWKDCLLPGKYTKHATQQALDFTTADLEEIAATTKEYLRNGNAIPIPLKDHEEERNIGYVVDARVQDGRLQLYHQFIGADAALEALRNKVSVKIVGNHIDPKNNKYKRCIVHSSLTGTPVVTGQRDWAPIAASRGEPSAAPVYVFAASRSSDMTIAQLRALLGLGDNVSDADVLKAAHDRIAAIPALETSKTTLEGEKVALSQKVKETETKVTELTTQLEAKKTEVVSLSQKVNKRQPSAHELYFAKEALTAKRQNAITSGAITAAVADRAEAKFLGNTKLDSISLSRDVTEADIALSAGMAQAMDFYDVIAGNKPGPASGEQSGNQNQPNQAPDPNKPANSDGKKDEDKNKTNFKSAKDVVAAQMSKRYAPPKPAGAAA